MKIVLTGGGTGGHFYPLIAIAQEIQNISAERKLLSPTIFYLSDSPYNKKLLFDNNIQYKFVPAGKWRRYFSILNFFDFFKTAVGLIKALWTVYSIFPDVVVGKGGYASFPVLWASKILSIPVVIHESDSVPGKVNEWAGKFAKNIALSYAEAASYFPKEKTAWTGNPTRKEIAMLVKEGAHEYLNLSKNVPVILILGGSQGARAINDSVLDALPQLVEKYQIIHQVGQKNLEEAKGTADVVLYENDNKERYKVFGYLDTLAMRMSAGASDLVISRGGSTIFEIAAWGLPSIIIPIRNSNGDHQRKNAYNYARTGAASAIEEDNLTTEILLAEINKIMSNPEMIQKMKTAAKNFSRLDAARKIAEVTIDIALTHEK